MSKKSIIDNKGTTKLKKGIKVFTIGLIYENTFKLVKTIKVLLYLDLLVYSKGLEGLTSTLG